MRFKLYSGVSAPLHLRVLSFVKEDTVIETWNGNHLRGSLPATVTCRVCATFVLACYCSTSLYPLPHVVHLLNLHWLQGGLTFIIHLVHRQPWCAAPCHRCCILCPVGTIKEKIVVDTLTSRLCAQCDNVTVCQHVASYGSQLGGYLLVMAGSWCQRDSIQPAPEVSVVLGFHLCIRTWGKIQGLYMIDKSSG